MKRLILASSLLILLPNVCVCAQGKFHPFEWQYHKDINPPGEIASTYGFFEIDPEVYDGSFKDPESLRIVDGNSQEVPYQVLMQPADTEKKALSATVVENSVSPQHGNILILDIGDGKPSIDDIEVAAAEESFMRKASVEGSDDKSRWQMVQDAAYIYRFSQEVVSEGLEILFPKASFRYYRVRIFNDGEAPLQITGAAAYRVKTQAPELEQWPLTILDVITQNDESRTDVIMDAIYQGLPISQMNLEAGNRNYQRNAEVYTSENRQDWLLLGRSSFFAYDLPQFNKQSTTLTFDQNQSGRYFKLIVYNYDNQPFEPEKIMGQGLLRRTVFWYEKGNSYKLFFGSSGKKSPDYTLKKGFTFGETDELPRFSLGPRQLNSGQADSTDDGDIDNTSFYWMVIAVMFILFTLIIFVLAGAGSGSAKPPPDDFN